MLTTRFQTTRLSRSRSALVGLGLVASLAAGWIAPALAGDDVGPTDVDKIAALAAEDNQVMEHERQLCFDIGPRLTGSHNIEKAYGWAVERFKSFGLKNVHTEVWGEWPIGFDRAGKPSAKVISAEGERSILIGSNAWTAGTDGPVRGPAIYEPRTPKELEKVKDKLKGAWLVSRRGTQLSPEDRDALKKGIEESGYVGRIRSTQTDLIVTDGSFRGLTMAKLPKHPSVMTTKTDWKVITKLLDANEACELELDVPNRFFAGPVPNKNVIADIPGTEKPDELVIVGGHIDSWDGAQGATDNGTGVSTTLEAARLLVKSGLRPKRTIRFMLWSGEEQGLFGSAGYIKKHKDELAKISCVLVHDGGTNYVSGLKATEPMMGLLEPALAPLKKLDKKLTFTLKKVKYLPQGVGSDHDSFLGAGVPGFFWEQAGKDDYEYGHHTQHDLFEKVVPEYQKHSAVTIAGAALAIANLETLLPRTNMLPPKSERPARKMLGVQTDEDLTITSVVEDSLAEQIELQEGDKILSLGGTVVKNNQELRAAIAASDGETELKILRNGEELTLKVPFPVAKKPTPGPEQPKKRWF